MLWEGVACYVQEGRTSSHRPAATTMTQLSLSLSQCAKFYHQCNAAHNMSVLLLFLVFYSCFVVFVVVVALSLFCCFCFVVVLLFLVFCRCFCCFLLLFFVVTATTTAAALAVPQAHFPHKVWVPNFNSVTVCIRRCLSWYSSVLK